MYRMQNSGWTLDTTMFLLFFESSALEKYSECSFVVSVMYKCVSYFVWRLFNLHAMSLWKW